jgi:hypothetical protein
VPARRGCGSGKTKFEDEDWLDIFTIAGLSSAPNTLDYALSDEARRNVRRRTRS